VISACGSRVLAAASSLEPTVRQSLPNGGNIDAARRIGQLIAERARNAGIDQVAFDRAGFRYHGRIKALADAAREAGLKF
jgi:large subunit ribosomal protein L18